MTATLHAQHMVVRVRFSGTAATVVVSGELDVCTEHALTLALTGVLEQRPERLVLDLTDVTFIDCAAVRVLAAACHAMPGSGRAVLRRPSRTVRRVLELTGMTACFQIECSAPGRHLARTRRRGAQPWAGLRLRPVPHSGP